ncbi:MAG: class I SAM-dependent methyltransferase [Bdellovibrionales bacterium]
MISKIKKKLYPIKRMLTEGRPNTGVIGGKIDGAYWGKTRPYLRQFQYKSSNREWQQLMMYNEIMFKLHDIPGDVAEFGVAGGISFVSFVRINEILERGREGLEKRSFYGFDSFEGLPELSDEDYSDKEPVPQMQKGGFVDTEGFPQLKAFADKHDNVHLVKGWFDKSLPEFFTKNPHVSFSLIHVDCDLYDSTKSVLELCWPRLNPGGVILFDEINQPNYPGETVAFVEYFENKPDTYTMHRVKSMPAKRYLVKK